jgi:hypothetical protein
MHLKRYLIIVEELMEEESLTIGSPWLKTQEIELPADSLWRKVYTWEHPSTLVMEMKVGDRPALIKVYSRGAEQVHSGRTLIEINKLKTDRPEAAEEAAAIYTRLMNSLVRKSARIYNDWDKISAV